MNLLSLLRISGHFSDLLQGAELGPLLVEPQHCEQHHKVQADDLDESSLNSIASELVVVFRQFEQNVEQGIAWVTRIKHRYFCYFGWVHLFETLYYQRH